jgi:hypothetical protein
MKFKPNLIIILVLILNFLFSCGNSNKKENNSEDEHQIFIPVKREIEDKSPLIITVQITGKKTKSINSVWNTYPFRVSILNQTDTIFGFWLMSCSRFDYFELNTKGIEFNSEDCDSNFPTLIEIPSGKECILSGEFIVTQLDSIKQKKNIKIGLHVIEKKYNLNHDMYNKDIKDTLIWCREPISYDW